MLSARRVMATLAGLLIASTSIAWNAAPASAACIKTDNCFVGGYPGNESGTALNADGLYARISTEYGLDVGLGDGTAAVTPGAREVRGFNARGMQINAYGSSKQFVGVGYTAGCGKEGANGGTGCTGKNASGGVIKRWFLDGQNCNLACGYFFATFEEIQGGTAYTYQLQRNLVGDTYRWRWWTNGIERKLQDLANANNPTMVQGYAFMFAERSGSQDTYGRDIPLNMTTAYIDRIMYHKYGNVSTRPPGTYAYYEPYILNAANDFNPSCGLTPLQPLGTGLRTEGRC